MAQDSTSIGRMEMRQLPAKTKMDRVSELLAILREDLASMKMTEEERRATLEELKIHGRDPKVGEPIFTFAGIQVLTKHGFTNDSSPSSFEALRCLANAMLLDPKTRQIFVDLGCAMQAAQRLKNEDSDNEFLISRILFLLTYDSNVDFGPLFEHHALGESINAHIARHAKQFTENGKQNLTDPVDQAALSESLKLLFNISNFYPQHVSTFNPSIDSIFTILDNITLPKSPYLSPINHLINALLNLDLSSYRPTNPNSPIETLTTVLHQSLTLYTPSDLESNFIPLLLLLRKPYPGLPPPQKALLKKLLLPNSTTDRDLPLGQTNTLPSKLLRLSTSPTTPNLSNAISALLYDLSDKNPTTFIHNVGYGFAAGFLLSHDIPVPTSAASAQRPGFVEDGDRDVGGHAEEEAELTNPITGQKLSKESAGLDAGPEMSEEEKEREAERLFVLFERLRATGVVGVGDPVRETLEKGGFEGENGRGRKGKE